MRALLASTLFRDTAKLVLGTAGSRVILLLALPFVTRLYGPEDFRLLAVFLALVSTISVVACLRLEIAIPLADNDDDAANLLAMALVAATGVAAILLVPSFVAPEAFAFWLGNPAIAPYLWLVPIGVFLSASYTALQFWATRMRRFSIIARTRVGQAATGACTMLGLGWLGLAPLGLLLGNVLTLGAGGLSLAVQALRNDRDRLSAVNPRRMAETLRHYRRYPIYSTPGALANVAGIQIPILIIAAVSGGEAGQLFLAMQVMAAPMSLLGASVGQIYASRAAEELRSGRLHNFTVTMMRRLFLIGLGPIALAALLAPVVFPPIFGHEWQRAGIIVAWIAPWMLAEFVVSPVSMVMNVLGRQVQMMWLTLSGAAIRISGIAIATIFYGTFHVEAYAATSLIFYVICATTFYNFSRRDTTTRKPI